MESVETELKFIRPIVCYLDGLKRLVSASNGEEEPLLLVAETVPFGMALGLGTTRGSTGGAGGLVSCRKGKLTTNVDKANKGVSVPMMRTSKSPIYPPNFLENTNLKTVGAVLTLPIKKGKRKLSSISHCGKSNRSS